MYRKHPNHTYGRNRNNSANNWAIISLEGSGHKMSGFIQGHSGV